MPLHTNHEPARDHLPAAPYLAGEGVIVPPVASSPAFSIWNSDGRPTTRSFDCRHTPSPAAWRAVFSYANPSQAHAATRLHGATL